MTCIHDRDDFFIGIGHPRCGTGFAASLLSASGKAAMRVYGLRLP